MQIIRGKIVSGQALGRKIGYPTLNIAYDGEDSGVFVAKVKFIDGDFAGQEFIAAVNLGTRPTVEDSGVKFCESFLLDFSANIAASTEIEVQLLQKIREVEKFKNLDDLTVQIADDVKQVRAFF